MRHLIIAAITVLVVTSISWAIKAEMPKDGAGAKLQACAPTRKNDATITGNSQTLNVTDSNCWMVYVASDTKFRAMSTATKTGIQHTIPGGAWYTEATGDNKFLNFSTNGAAGTFRSNKP